MKKDLHLVPNNFQKSTKLFTLQKSILENILSHFKIDIQHVGSTSIPNTIGKGIIDILVIADSVEDQEKIKALLVANDYRQGELNKVPDGRLFFCDVQGQTKAGDTHIHLVVKDSKNLETLDFRNYLLENPDKVLAYNQEKLRLLKATDGIRKKYVVQKGEFISTIMNEIASQKKDRT